MDSERSFDSTNAAQRLFLDFLDREERGENPDFELLCREHPALAAELQDLLAAHSELEALRVRLQRSLPVPQRVQAGVDSALGPGGAAVADGTGLPAGPWDEFLAQLGGRKGASRRYRLIREIGRGGMGVILEIWDEDLCRPVAMKVIRERDGRAGRRPDPAEIGRFFEEAQITGQLEHPGIVPVHELGLDDAGRIYFTMKLVDGRNLLQVIELASRGEQGWTRPRVLDVLLKVCDAVAFAHSKSVIHRDLKPENVMVGQFGEAYVMDWGVARLLRSGTDGERPSAEEVPAARPRTARAAVGARDGQWLTHDGDLVGTPWYMPPEQARGRLDELDARADVYAIGAILYHVIAGRRPFGDTADGLEALQRLKDGPPVPLKDLPDASPELVAICDKAMSREPDRRYTSAKELAGDLRAYVEGRVVRAHRTGPVIELRKWIGRNKGMVASIASAVAIATIAAAGLLRQEVHAREADRRQQALRNIDAAELAVQRGEWDKALEALRTARTGDPSFEIPVGLREAEIHMATTNHKRADEAVRALEARTDLSRHLGKVRLLRARLEFSAGANPEGVEELVAHARAAGLSEADDAYAAAMVAQSTDEALARLGRVVELDPLHHDARDWRLSLWFFEGRFEEAEREAEALKVLYPRDHAPRIVLASVFAARGERERASSVHRELAALMSAEDHALLGQLLDAFAVPSRIPASHWISGDSGLKPQDIASLLQHAGPAATTLQQRNLERFYRPGHGYIWAAYEPALEFLLGHFLPALPTLPGLNFKPADAPDTVRRLEAVIDRHPDAFLHYILASAIISTPPRSGEDELGRKGRAAVEYRKAIEMPSLIYGVRRAALHFAIRCEYEIGFQGQSEEQRALALKHIRDAVDRYELCPAERDIYIDIAFTLGRTDLALSVVEDWLAGHPDDLDILGKRAKLLAYSGAHKPAIDVANAVLAKRPDDRRASEAKNMAVQEAKKFASGL